MSTEFNHDGSITVIGYSLAEFCFELCDLAAKGFTVTMENNKAASGGYGSYYSATLVPRHHYRIDLQGNHLNVSETPTETPVNETKGRVGSVEQQPVQEPIREDKPEQQVKPAPKTTRSTKKA